jgi:hypothetical protein
MTSAEDQTTDEWVAEVAQHVATGLEESSPFESVDGNDLGEVTVRLRGRVFRATFFDITDEDA